MSSNRYDKVRTHADKAMVSTADREATTKETRNTRHNSSSSSNANKGGGGASGAGKWCSLGENQQLNGNERRAWSRKENLDQREASNDEYDHCDEFRSPRKTHKFRSRDNELMDVKQLSPMKRNNENMSHEDSPKKRARLPFALDTAAAASDPAQPRTPKYKNKGSVSLCMQNEAKNSISSTPKSERKVNLVNRLAGLNNSDAIERNMSNNWGDILEELETQTKELNEYVDQVSSKYKLDKDKLLKSIESDAETLRKRQKRINMGKITPEYQRYVMSVSKRKRRSFDPKTPNKFHKCSRRKFDGLIKKWRKLLHVWDENPDNLKDFKYSMEDEKEDDERSSNLTDEFGCTSKIGDSSIQTYNLDDYDVIDYDVDSDPL